MRSLWRSQSANWLTGGIHFLIFAAAAQSRSARAWPYALVAMACVSLAAWIANYRRMRQIADTPLSNIATAAQGYVEISGRAEAPSGVPLTSQLTNAVCVWFRYEVHEKSADDKWSLHDSGISDDPFLVNDASGQCIIDPANAEVICSRKQTWTSGSYRYTEWLLLPRDVIYALGDFVTLSTEYDSRDINADVGALLADWKTDQPQLLKRFDLNRDGKLDLNEWELARRQAIREVETAHRETQLNPGTHVLRAPGDGRLFLISNELPAKLRLRYQLWSWAHAAIFVGALGTAGALI